MQSDIDDMLQTPSLNGSVTGIVVENVRTHKVLYARNASVRLMPASNEKLFTGATALKILGDNFVMHTKVLADQPIATDTIKGNLYLRGGGDPLLTADDIKAFANQLAKAGLKHITGDIVGDASLFTDGPYPGGWSWDYLADDYAPQISALEVEQGVTSVSVTPGKAVGDKPVVTLTPTTGYVSIVNQASTVAVGSPATLSITRAYNKGEVVVSGNVPVGYVQPKPYSITVDNPALYAATLLAEDLLASGVTVDGSVHVGTASASAVTLLDRASAPLKSILPLMLKPSNNLIAESLIRLIGSEKGNKGSFNSGYIVERAYLASIGIPSDQYDFSDGSGVTRLDLVSPGAVVTLLTSIATQPNFKEFYDALPVAGIDGTLKKRMKGTPAENNAHAKTGTLRYAHTLSGYVTGPRGNILAFSIMNNNFVTDSETIGKFQDALVARLARGYTPVPTKNHSLTKSSPTTWHHVIIIPHAAPHAAAPAAVPVMPPAQLAKPVIHSDRRTSPSGAPQKSVAKPTVPSSVIAVPSEQPATRLNKKSNAPDESFDSRVVKVNTNAPQATAAVPAEQGNSKATGVSHVRQAGSGYVGIYVHRVPKKPSPQSGPQLAIPDSMKVTTGQ